MPQPHHSAPRSGKSVLIGVAFWLTFAVVAVALRGVRWDEDYEFAQVITRAVPYPLGHPLFRHARGLFSIQTHVLAALNLATDSPVLLCGLRNVLFLAATVLPAFVLGAVLAGTTAGHAAAAMMLLGTHVPFFSTYPQFVWPYLYSNGHIGTGAGLLTLGLLTAGATFPENPTILQRRWLNAALFLVGLMPCIHLGQWPPVLAAAAFVLVERRRCASEPWLRRLTWLAAGLAVSAASVVVARALSVSDPLSGPYVSTLDVEAVWGTYMTRYATHRSFPWGTAHIALVALPLLAAGAARSAHGREGQARRWRVMFAYSVIVAAIVWFTALVQLAAGPRIPYVLIGWMPYRLMNHVPPLLMVASTAVLIGSDRLRRPTAMVVAAVLAIGACRPALRPLVGESFFARYVECGIGLAFLLYGAAMATVALDLRDQPRFFAGWMAAAMAAAIALAAVHQFGLVCALAGFVAAVLLAARPVSRSGSRPAEALLVAAAACAVIATTYGQWTQRTHLPISPFERAVAAYLAGRGDAEAMIVPPYGQEGLQARTGHPMMADMATITWIGYSPRLGPAIAKVHEDIYGMPFSPDLGPPSSKPWFDQWAGRSREDWCALARAYDFHYVIAPAFIRLDLPVAIEGETERLYHVPTEDST
ncbi:MAG TPA: hypothetical protein PLO37_19150 [Candidatus Hydrogenedentes bacterium]|nr:hypothetical protein [Candidatus Hydrogenedentota bacterium]HPG68969.1 hypothetical protein [Candidatus Hydrogenedentota bacterium]